MKSLPYIIIALFLSISFNIQACPYPLRMDFNNDCRVDLSDLAIFCEEWLQVGLDLEAELDLALTNVNSAIDLYVTDHSGLLPGAGEVPFVAALTGTTNPDGNPGTDFGPYLSSIPYNPYINLNTVDIDGTMEDYSHGWYFDSTTGSFNADHDIIYEEILLKLNGLRRAVRYYQIDHLDNAPKLYLFHVALTLCSNTEAAFAQDYVSRTATNIFTHPYGPYLQMIPSNPINDSHTVAAADATGVGWLYDEITGDIYVGVADLNPIDPNDNDLLQKLWQAGAAYGI